MLPVIPCEFFPPFPPHNPCLSLQRVDTVFTFSQMGCFTEFVVRCALRYSVNIICRVVGFPACQSRTLFRRLDFEISVVTKSCRSRRARPGVLPRQDQMIDRRSHQASSSDLSINMTSGDGRETLSGPWHLTSFTTLLRPHNSRCRLDLFMSSRRSFSFYPCDRLQPPRPTLVKLLRSFSDFPLSFRIPLLLVF